MILINKNDGALKTHAAETYQLYASALHLTSHRGTWQVPIEKISALEKEGLDSVWDHIQKWQSLMTTSGTLTHQRKKQDAHWFQEQLHAFALQKIAQQLKNTSETLGQSITEGALSPFEALRKAQDHLDSLFQNGTAPLERSERVE